MNIKKGNYLFLFLLFCSVDITAQALSQKISLWATYYYVPELIHSEKGIDLLNEKGESTGIKLDSCDWCTAAIEGTVRVKKSKTSYLLNYAGRSEKLQYNCQYCNHYKNYGGYLKTGKILWEQSSDFGKGVRDYNLVPFVTIAVDSTLIPFGSVLYIPKAKGMSYTNEKGDTIIHNGYFFAGDTGSKIKKNHIDVFIGTATENPFDFIRSNQKGIFDAYLQSDKEIILQLTQMHQ